MTATPPIERDTSGRFVKPEIDEKAPLIRDDDVHPLARILFGWVEGPRVSLMLLILVVMICGLLVAADLVLNRHEYIDAANITGFYGIWGFCSFALAVLSGWPLGKLLRRSEDYYGEADTTPQDVEVEE